MISLLDRIETHTGKGRKCWLPAFSPFPTVFSKAFFHRNIKSRFCVVKSAYSVQFDHNLGLCQNELFWVGYKVIVTVD